MVFLSRFDGIELPASADFHVHLRDESMMETVVPTIRAGGVNMVYVMPNLSPPLTSVSDVLSYKSRLEKEDPKVQFLMTLYLHKEITPAVVKEAHARGIVGIKSYPAGVTTNSNSGVLSYEPFYPVFHAMEECGMVLNLHGECPSDHTKDITILNAESKFLPTLKLLHAKFPRLKIVLEHCTTKEAIEVVEECGANVVGTITIHHLFLTVDEWADDPICFCKPVAKWPSDRAALIKAAINSKGKFFLGSDSAPHNITAKNGGKGKISAGVFTQPYVTQLYFTALERAVDLGVISEESIIPAVVKGFLGEYGRQFYQVQDVYSETIVLSKGNEKIQELLIGNNVKIVPFRHGLSTWSVTWKR
ncbi:putative dihydroorotase [Erysiphe necator]|uniref:dihydroorotase n=1 Tax=Uncinula necator TaxID=52586 RepID=A0A0B1P554_UNCNE|nr:putative dihydroorotase [Erysiphe necator]KHJ32081.1 putative ura4 dihydroorotase [Erysiphe necator]